MIDLSMDLRKVAVADARLAPSVHNVRPSRWRLAGNRLRLLGDPARAIPVADPVGRDWRLSHGAHLEGLSLALAARGARLIDIQMPAAQPGPDGLVPIAECSVAPDAGPPSREPVGARELRGAFGLPTRRYSPISRGWARSAMTARCDNRNGIAQIAPWPIAPRSTSCVTTGIGRAHGVVAPVAHASTLCA